MEIEYTYRFKLKLTKQQTDRLNSWLGACRYVYNLALDTRIYAYKAYGETLNYYSLANQLKYLKDTDWIKDVPSQSLQDVLERLERAYDSFFERGAGFPKWAKKGRYKSIVFKSCQLDTHNRVKLPKLGSVKYFCSQEIQGKIRRATIIKEVDGFYISILTRRKIAKVLNPCENQAGLDLGVSHLLVTSDGDYFLNADLDKWYRKLRIEQRSLSRKVKRSNNWYKQLRRVQRVHMKIRRIRQDHLQKVSTQLADRYDYLVMEDLKIQNMVRSAKGRAEAPGKHVAQKRGLNRQISRQGWGMLKTMLRYKLAWKDGELEPVPAQYTSQQCSQCGHIEKRNRRSQASFVCCECGYATHADQNAAINIWGRGTSHVRQREALACA